MLVLVSARLIREDGLLLVPSSRARTINVASQSSALHILAKVAQYSSVRPIVVQAARSIVSDCDPRDERCEVSTIFEAVKHGTDRWKPLAQGLRYVNDPVYSDVFVSPERIFDMFPDGHASGDCDEAAVLIVCLLSAIGYTAGLRAWGERGEEFSHVYAVVAYPKHMPPQQQKVLGLDATVPESRIGWEPPGGHVKTAWIVS